MAYYKALQSININGARAFNVGDVVPDQIVLKNPGWLNNPPVVELKTGTPPGGSAGSDGTIENSPYVPVGGDENQVLAKKSAADRDVQWVTISGAGGGGSTDPEVVRDTIAAALTAGANVSIVNDDAANTITIAITGVPTHTHTSTQISDFTEATQDVVGGLIKAGSNVTVAYDDAAGTFTINSTAGGGGGTDAEIVRDTIAAALLAGSGIQITADDASDTIAIQVANLSASQVTSGVFATGRLGTGTATAAKVLYGDGTWKDAPTGGGGSAGPYSLNGVVRDVGQSVPGDLPTSALVFRKQS